jgi:uncharacterized protein (DUF433 family)
VTPEEIVKEYQGLTRQDIQACILFATKTLETSAFVPLAVEPA